MNAYEHTRHLLGLVSSEEVFDALDAPRRSKILHPPEANVARGTDENPLLATKAPRQNAQRAGKAQRKNGRKIDVSMHLGVFVARPNGRSSGRAKLFDRVSRIRLITN